MRCMTGRHADEAHIDIGRVVLGRQASAKDGSVDYDDLLRDALKDHAQAVEMLHRKRYGP